MKLVEQPSGQINAVTSQSKDLDDSQLVTLKLESGHYLRFQPDTGAQCNVIPLNLYKKATKDYRLERVTPLNTQLAAYGGSKLSVVGQVRITVWRDDLKCKLDCKLVDSNTIRPILGDPGLDSGCEGKSKRAEKYGTKKKSEERRVEPLGTMSYQTSSKRSPPSWLLIGARKRLCFSAQSEGRTAANGQLWRKSRTYLSLEKH